MQIDHVIPRSIKQHNKGSYVRNVYFKHVADIAHPDTVIPDTTDGQRRQYLVTNLKPGVSYQFKIRAVNGYGVGEESNPTRESHLAYF